MTGFDPGEGWRRLAVDEILDAGAEVIHYSTGDAMCSWVRVPPVPPLPVEPYTVIRVTWDPRQTGYAGHVLVRLPEGSYHDWSFGGDEGDGFGSAEKLRREIVAFDVLAEPRAGAVQRAEESTRRLTAKAVLEEVAGYLARGLPWGTALPMVARDFGVDPDE